MVIRIPFLEESILNELEKVNIWQIWKIMWDNVVYEYFTHIMTTRNMKSV